VCDTGWRPGAKGRVAAAFVHDVDLALFDVYVGPAVFAHDAAFHDVAIGCVFEHRPDDVEGRVEIRPRAELL
jgi:hypothetical protein